MRNLMREARRIQRLAMRNYIAARIRQRQREVDHETEQEIRTALAEAGMIARRAGGAA